MRILFIFFIVFFYSFSSFAAEAAENELKPLVNNNDSRKPLEKKLQDNKALIAKLKERIEAQKNKKTQEESLLKEYDHKIATLTQSLKETETSLSSAEKAVAEIKGSINALNTAMREKEARLKQQLKAVYLFHHNTPLKLFLSQQDPSEFTRLLRYYHYLEKYNLETFTRLLNEYQSLAESHQEKEGLISELQQLKEKKVSLIKEVRQQKTERQKFLNDIDKALAQDEKTLSHSKRNEQALIEQIKFIETTLESHPFKESPSLFKPKPFTQAKGKLFWPIREQLSPSLRSPIMVKANVGDPVYATYDGRVVFADHFRGFGLLIIIDHHEGFMSLYGHNQTLYKNIGDKVQKGELIGRVGTGTEKESGLYFEIRRHGKPETLVNWFH